MNAGSAGHPADQAHEFVRAHRVAGEMLGVKNGDGGAATAVGIAFRAVETHPADHADRVDAFASEVAVAFDVEGEIAARAGPGIGGRVLRGTEKEWTHPTPCTGERQMRVGITRVYVQLPVSTRRSLKRSTLAKYPCHIVFKASLNKLANTAAAWNITSRVYEVTVPTHYDNPTATSTAAV